MEQDRDDRSEAQLTARALRNLADYLDAHPDLEVTKASATLYLWPEGKEEMAEMTRALADGAKLGQVVKDATQGTYTVTRHFGTNVRLEVLASREAVCERRQVGTKTITEREVVEEREVEVEVPIYEWDCDPILDN